MDSVRQPDERPELSVVMPLYNEESSLEQILDAVLALPLKLEVIAVDDGSEDASPRILAAVAARDERLIVIRQDRNRGKGAAVRTGIGAARGDVVVIQDADLEYDPSDLVRMLAKLKELGTPVIYGSRRLTAKSSTADARYYYGGVALSVLTNLLYGSRLTDEPTCYKMWRRELIQSIDLKADGFEFCPEVTAKVLKRAIKIPEIQISYRPRRADEGKKIRLRDGWIAMWTLIKLRFSR